MHMQMRLLFMLSSMNFMASNLTFKFLIHFELIFVYSIKVSLFHYFAWGWKEKWGLEKQEKERSPLWRL